MADPADGIVAGRYCTCSLETFMWRAARLIEEEQRKPSPDNALIAVLCDAVRLAREDIDGAHKRLLANQTPGLALG